MSVKKNTKDAVQAALEQLHHDYLDYATTKKRLWREFTSGVIRGLGMALGGTIIFAILAFFLTKFLVVPGARELYNDMLHEAAQFQQGFTANQQ